MKEPNYSIQVIKDLLLTNQELNNTQIAKLYNEKENTNFNPDLFRKTIKVIRRGLNLENPSYGNSNGVLEKSVELETITSSDSIIKVNNDKGTFESTVESMFEPKNSEELAALHHIDLTKYKISSYWSKLKSNGKFTSSVFCVERKLGDSLTIDEIKDALSEVIKVNTIKPYNLPKLSSKTDKALFIFVADEHVGAAVTDGLYENKWDKTEYYKRKSKIIEVVNEQGDLYGSFDKIVYCNLGDTMDGFNGQTTRGGHILPQNMTNKEAIQTFVEVNKAIWDDVIKLQRTDTYEIYNVDNSNHGGLGFDFAANYALEMYLTHKYPEFKVTSFDKIINTFSFGKHNLHLSHGKDDKYMKRNFPRYLDAKTENYVKEYMDENDYKKKTDNQHLIKGDLHFFGTEQGKFFSYTNIPSLFGSSAWVASNFGKGKAGFCYSVVSKDSDSFGFTPVWFK